MVIMKLDQAIAMNERFVRMAQEIKGMRHIADSMATHNFREKYNTDAHILKLQQDLAYARIDSRKEMNFQAKLMFGFWGAFITYLQFF